MGQRRSGRVMPSIRERHKVDICSTHTFGLSLKNNFEYVSLALSEVSVCRDAGEDRTASDRCLKKRSCEKQL